MLYGYYSAVVSSYWEICRYDERHRIRYWYWLTHRSSRNFLQPSSDRLELRQSAFTYFVPRPYILSQTRKFVVQCWRCLKIAELPSFGAHDRTFCWNSGAKWLGRSREPELKEGNHSGHSFDWGLRFITAGIRMFWYAVQKEERIATTRQGITKMFACYEKILNEKQGPLSHQTSLLYFFKAS